MYKDIKLIRSNHRPVIPIKCSSISHPEASAGLTKLFDGIDNKDHISIKLQSRKNVVFEFKFKTPRKIVFCLPYFHGRGRARSTFCEGYYKGKWYPLGSLSKNPVLIDRVRVTFSKFIIRVLDLKEIRFAEFKN